MRRCLTPRVITVVMWLCTLAAVASALAWLASCWWVGVLGLHAFDFIAISRGCLAVSWEYGEHHGKPEAYVMRRHRAQYMLYWGSVARDETFQTVEIAVPLWAIGLAFGVPAGYLCAKRHRLRPTDCQACGYDLRGLKGERCPECGAATTTV